MGRTEVRIWACVSEHPDSFLDLKSFGTLNPAGVSVGDLEMELPFPQGPILFSARSCVRPRPLVLSLNRGKPSQCFPRWLMWVSKDTLEFHPGVGWCVCVWWPGGWLGGGNEGGKGTGE